MSNVQTPTYGLFFITNNKIPKYHKESTDILEYMIQKRDFTDRNQYDKHREIVLVNHTAKTT